MSQRRLLLLSNSRNFGQGYLEHAEETIKEFLGEKVKKVLFVPYAGVRMSYDEFAQTVGERFHSMGYGFDSIHRHRDLSGAVKGAESIIVGGGNTFHLLKSLYDHDLIGSIRSAVDLGVPFIGWSAGANIASPTIRTTNDMPIVQPPSFDALGIIDFQINPHYTDAQLPHHSGETRAERIAEYVIANPGDIVVGLPEGSILRVEGPRIELLGVKPARVFRFGHEATDHQPRTSLELRGID